MADIRVITPNEHSGKRWYKPESYRFAARDRLVVIGLSEIPKAMMSLPIAFAKTEDMYLPVAMQGFVTGQNLLVDAKGDWLVDYIPVFYRTYPFKLAKNAQGQFVLCVNHESGLVSDNPGGFPFFSDDKTMGAELNTIASQLMQFETERAISVKITKLLDECGLIEPWPIHIQQTEEIQTVDGVFRINEANLNALSLDKLAAIKEIGGLMLCYGQLFSMQHLQQLGSVARRMHWANRANPSADKVVALNIVDDNGILSFANL